MNYHNDDGSTFGGIVTAALCVICFCAGYTVREHGITFRVDQVKPVTAHQKQNKP